MDTYLVTYQVEESYEGHLGRSEVVTHVRSEVLDKDDLANFIADEIYHNHIILNVSPLARVVHH